VSLSTRVLVLVAAINVTVFAVGWTWASGRLADEERRLVSELDEQLGATIRRSIQPTGDVNAPRILRWGGWQRVEDAILVDANVSVLEDGVVRPRGLFLNPVGAGRRAPDFDRDVALASVVAAIRSGRSVGAVEGGRAVPIEEDGGEVWGGCWYRAEEPLSTAGLARTFLFALAGSTLLLAVGTFAALRSLVLRPVEDLAEGARRVRGGDLTVRVEEPARRDELADLTRSFNQMTSTVHGFNARLEREVEEATRKARRAEQAAMRERRLAAMGELAAGIAHEINNPLGGLQNAVEVLEHGDPAPGKRARYFGLLRDGLGRIGETVGQLLRLTPRNAPAEAVDLAQVSGDAVALVRHRAEAAGVRLRIVMPDGSAATEPIPAGGVPAVVGSRSDLGQAVLNLLVNALDALEEEERAGGGVDVRLEVVEGAVRVAVVDDGPGVPEAELPRVSDLFHSTKEVGRGSGLGLSIVHGVVRAHGGSVELANEPEGGFRVELTLPREGAEDAG
jgi:signal transduction histidine kinase